MDIQASEFLMIGNSLKSDVLPVLELGGYGIHVPFHTTWEHERVDVIITNDKFHSVTQIVETLRILDYQIIDIENWHRKEIYHFFSAFDEPFFGVTVHVNLQGAIDKANKNSIPLFGYYLHKLMMAVNEIDAFKLRILDGKVVKYEVIHASATLPRTDGSFGFSFIEYGQDVHQFIKNMDAESQRISRSHQLFSERNGIDCIHVSALPWLKFTAFVSCKGL